MTLWTNSSKSMSAQEPHTPGTRRDAIQGSRCLWRRRAQRVRMKAWFSRSCSTDREVARSCSCWMRPHLRRWPGRRYHIRFPLGFTECMPVKGTFPCAITNFMSFSQVQNHLDKVLGECTIQRCRIQEEAIPFCVHPRHAVSLPHCHCQSATLVAVLSALSARFASNEELVQVLINSPDLIKERQVHSIYRRNQH